MKQFTGVQDVSNLPQLVLDAANQKLHPYDHQHLGKHKTIGLIFMNPSLRTRLSTQKAAMNLGLDVMVMNVDKEGWKLETQQGAVMNGDAAEHVKDAVAVMGQYCDIIGVRSFAQLQNRHDDYSESVLNDFIRYAGVPIVSLESATRHPLQSLADILTIEEYKRRQRPKIVLTWAPHPKSLPQAVPNSFAEWTIAAGYDLTIAFPKGYELDENFTKGATFTHNQNEAFANADFIYAKNWSAYSLDDYGKVLSQDARWTVSMDKMKLTNNAYLMHCLPVRRNVVVNDDVLDSEQSLIIPQAGNRVWAAQAVLKHILSHLG